MYADCYVLTNKRTFDFVQSFLDQFVPNRTGRVDEYEIPQYGDTQTFYKTADELIVHLEKNKKEPYAIYWSNNNESDLRGAMCFFTNDENLIVGLYCTTNNYPDPSIEDRFFDELKEFCGSEVGYITYEQPAPDNTKEFLKNYLGTIE